jgi:hypothetical protein
MRINSIISRIRLQPGTIVALVLCTLAVVLYGPAVIRTAMLFVPRKVDLATIASQTKVKFPPGTRLLDSRYVGFSLELHAKILLDRHQVATLIRSLPPGAETSSKERLDRLTETSGPKWWHPDSPDRYISIYMRLPSGFPLQGLVRLDEQNPVMYLYRCR